MIVKLTKKEFKKLKPEIWVKEKNRYIASITWTNNIGSKK